MRRFFCVVWYDVHDTSKGQINDQQNTDIKNTLSNIKNTVKTHK